MAGAGGATRVQLLAPPAVREDLSQFEITADAPDVVVVMDMGAGFSFEVLNSAFQSLLGGARLVAAHKNRYWLTEAGPTLDAGPFVAALEYAAGLRAELVGKPAPAFFRMAAAMLGSDLRGLAVVGDDPESDIAGARQAGLGAVQVRTGKGGSSGRRGGDEAKEMAVPDVVIDSIRDLPELVLGASA